MSLMCHKGQATKEFVYREEQQKKDEEEERLA
jgi:hypothetical protein